MPRFRPELQRWGCVTHDGGQASPTGAALTAALRGGYHAPGGDGGTARRCPSAHAVFTEMQASTGQPTRQVLRLETDPHDEASTEWQERSGAAVF
jgi:hypothetical protein